MKKIFALTTVLAWVVPAMLGAQPTADPTKMLQIFSAPIKTAGGDFTITILNDRTIEPLFGTSPAKFAIRTRSRMATILFIQGVANKEFELKPDVTVSQKGETLEGKASSIKNFVPGKVAKGQSVQGMVELPKKLNLYEPFKVMMGGQTAEFALNGDDVTDYGNKDK
jgi:hypothetical protein